MVSPTTLPPDSSVLFAPNSTGSTLPARSKRERQISRNSRPPSSAGIISSPSSPVTADDIHLFASPSSSRLDTTLPQRSPSSASFLSLPLFVQTGFAEENDNPPVSRLSQPRSLRNSSPSGVSPARNRDALLPPHSPLISERRGSRPLEQDLSRHQSRRWSTATHRPRASTGLASRLAEGASPYLRAGLDELRSIFDVDSNPIPISAMDEDDLSIHDEEQRRDDVSVFLDDSEREQDRSRSMSFDKARTAKKYALEHTSQSQSQSQIGLGLHRQTSVSNRGASRSTSQPNRQRAASNASSSLRGDDAGSDVGFSAAGLGIDRGLLAWSLAFIAFALMMMCAYGYAVHSDTFSTTLIVFFLTQPAFALMGLVALCLRRRALMDLFSRAMRAHVLAQACIVLLAYLDLSASSFYVSQSDATRGSGHRDPFRMVPTMEMRFGPVRGAFQAGDTPGINLLQSTLGGRSTLEKLESSARAHDSHVGDLQSRLIHLIVFLVQAALPIMAALIGQYIVAQRLAQLARRSNVSRQNSMCKQQGEKTSSGGGSGSPVHHMNRRGSTPWRYDSKTLPLSLSASSDGLSGQSARELPWPSSSSSPRLQAAGLVSKSSHSSSRPLGHSRSLSQPLDFLSPSKAATAAAAPPLPPKDATPILTLPLTESPPLVD